MPEKSAINFHQTSQPPELSHQKKSLCHNGSIIFFQKNIPKNPQKIQLKSFPHREKSNGRPSGRFKLPARHRCGAPRPRCVQLQQRRLGRRDAGRGWVGAAAAVHGTNRVKRGTFGPWKLEKIGAAFMANYSVVLMGV